MFISKLHFKGGIEAFVKFLDKSKENFISKPITFTEKKGDLIVDVAIIWNTGYYENMLCFTNNIPQIDGGTHFQAKSVFLNLGRAFEHIDR